MKHEKEVGVGEVEQPEMEQSESGQRVPPVMVAPHPLGGIQLIARGADGQNVVSRLEIPEAAMLIVHLNALVTMAFQTLYMQQAMAEQEARDASRILVPNAKR